MTGCMVPEWFRRFGDIPGIGYATPEQILGLALIVIGPTDMHRLAQIFGRQLGNDRSM